MASKTVKLTPRTRSFWKRQKNFPQFSSAPQPQEAGQLSRETLAQRKEDALKPHVSVPLGLLILVLNGISYFCFMMGSGLQPTATLLSVPVSALLGWVVVHMRRFRGAVAFLIATGIAIATALAFVAETHRNFALAKLEAGAMAVRISAYHCASGAWPDAIATVLRDAPHRLHGFYVHYEANLRVVPVLMLGRREWKARWNWQASRWDEEWPPANKGSSRLTKAAGRRLNSDPLCAMNRSGCLNTRR